MATNEIFDIFRSLSFLIHPHNVYDYFRPNINLSVKNLRNFLIIQAREYHIRRHLQNEKMYQQHYQEIQDLTIANLNKFRLYVVDILTTDCIEPDVFNNYFLIKCGYPATTTITREMYIAFLEYLGFTSDEINTLTPYLGKDYGTIKNFL